jgi:Lrp/AsnC family transcriptional regulator, regulator for asnA, asnC and gidA
MKIDETDLNIVRNLWDGRTPYSEIAEKIGLTTNTVRNRVNKMLDAGVLQIIGLVDITAIEGHRNAFMGFKIIPKHIKSALSQIGELRGVVAAAMVSGQYDIMAVVLFNKEYSHEWFLENEIQKVEGLVSTETFFAMGGANYQLRYVL